MLIKKSIALILAVVFLAASVVLYVAFSNAGSRGEIDVVLNLEHSMADFSIELFKNSIEADGNSLISPLSVMLALAMAANGAGSETLEQMESLLAGGTPITGLNGFLHAYAQGLPSSDDSMLHIANSIWFRDNESRFTAGEAFLQTNEDYYNAGIFSAAFDEQTVEDINTWVNTNTDGMISEILNEISDEAMMYLINAVAFDAQWQRIYYESDIMEGVFTDERGIETSADFMYSRESLYLDDGMATGFIKPYLGGYSFAALLPNEGISMETYIASLTGAGFINTLGQAQPVSVDTAMPKFDFEFGVNMNEALIALGIPNAFNPSLADFNGIGTAPEGNLYISSVVHKTYISVDERGTRAGAATMVEFAPTSAPIFDVMVVHLDRPFLFAIIDDATNLPVFIGTFMTP